MSGLAGIKYPAGIIFLLVILGLSHAASSQEDAAALYRRVDEKVMAFSKQRRSYDSVLLFVKKQFPDKRSQVRALYTWIAVNISYDTELLDHYRLSTGLGMIHLPSIRTQHPDTVIKYRKAVCEGFCLLMNRFCTQLSIPSQMVPGIARVGESQIDEKILHAWNAVYLDSSWRLIDITWSGGYISRNGKYVASFSDRYFCTPPALFIRDHWPLDAMWQLLREPVTKKEFYNHSEKRDSCCFNYNDSIKTFLKLSPADQEYVSLLHYNRYDPANISYQQSADLLIYNKAVSLFNLAVLYFEDYLTFAAKLQGKAVNARDTKRCIRLLAEPRKRLREGLDYCKNRYFFDPELARKFEEMVKASEKKLKEVDQLLADYRKLLKSLK